ncbi:MAG: hypothetical protein WC471_03025 [Candidatus Woesearchaeota archaeon]
MSSINLVFVILACVGVFNYFWEKAEMNFFDRKIRECKDWQSESCQCFIKAKEMYADGVNIHTKTIWFSLIIALMIYIYNNYLAHLK